ncbi:hypothetical protein Aperf_G00000004600 [Anoplocephala perfoliata]
MSTAYRCVNALRNSNSYGDLRGVTSFVQVLDESMCVIREDICDWLQRYVFSDADVPPLDDPADLLERLKSGVWLARLAYKLHYKVLSENLPKCPRGVKVTSREHKLYASLRGTGPSNALGQLTADNLPEFTNALTRAATSCLSECDTAIGGFIQPSNQNSYGRGAPSESGVTLRNRWTARSNIAEFLKWCRGLGISETVLFETNGLVYRTEEKNVLLTLMDLARLASRFGLSELPELVRMEHEIDALEAAAMAAGQMTQTATTTSTMTRGNPKVDIGVYATRLAERKAVSSPEGSPSSVSSDVDLSSYDSSISSVRFCSTATFATTDVFLDSSTDVEEGGGSLEVGTGTELSPLGSAATNTTESIDDASCQANGNNAAMTVSTHTNTVKRATRRTTLSAQNGDESDVTDKSTAASLPPRKNQQLIPKTRTRAIASRLPNSKNAASNTMNASKSAASKRSTSLADLRNLSNSRIKKRNINQNRDRSSKHKDESVSASSAVVKVGTNTNTRNFPTPKNLHRSPLIDHQQMTPIAKSQMPLSASSASSKHSSSGFASHSSSCSDLAAEVRKQTAQCTCCNRNRLIRLDEGRYQMGGRIYYLRRFRSHIMVRVGGGWLTLSEFLDRYDPCRQKEGEFRSLSSSHSNLTTAGTPSITESGSAIRIPASNILERWPSQDLTLKENCR